jgi:hypothetical protein
MLQRLRMYSCSINEVTQLLIIQNFDIKQNSGTLSLYNKVQSV